MLSYLKISNFALIESAELEFGAGFNVVTGESGAGKSILMGAVELLLGGRVDRGVIRTGCDRCTVAGVLAVPATLTAEVGAVLGTAEIPFDNDSGELQLRRVIGAANVRNFINDTPVSARLLGEVGRLLIDLHGANEQLSLSLPARQLELLDRYAGAESLRQNCLDCWHRLEALAAERREFEQRMPDEAEVSRLELLLEDIEKVNPAPGEDEALSARHKLGANARQVIESAGQLVEALTEGENSLADQLGGVYRKLTELARIDAGSTEPLLADCDGIQESVNALSEAISSLADKVELDPEELAAIETRLGEIFTLKRRYGPSLDEVLSARDAAQERLTLFRETRQHREEFSRREQALRGELQQAAQALSAHRRQAAVTFTGQVRGKLGAIGFAKCSLTAEFQTVDPGPNGMDRMELMFSANAGEEPQPLRRIASSGELSRLMLALKTVLADADSIPVVVFDEIDVNIGGETANRVGDELHSLGHHRQILCISHLAQVAARADRHYQVAKHTENGRTYSESIRLDAAGREREIARMLGGGNGALRHAHEILSGISPEK